MQSIIINLYQLIKSKIGLFIVFLVLILTILLLIIISNNNNNQFPASTPSPPSSIPQEISIINPTQPFNFNSINLTASNLFFAINQINSALIKITPEETSVVYLQPVKSFSYSNPFLAIIDKQYKKSLIIKNINNNQDYIIDLQNISPLIDVSYGSNANEVYLLANLNVIKRTTDLYLLLLDNPKPKRILSTNATDLKALSNQNILLFSYVDGKDLSTVSIYNIPSSTTLFTKKANQYLVSPSKNSVCTISSQSISTLNLPDLSEKNLKIKNVLGGYWANDSELIIIRNSIDGVTQATITPLTVDPIFKLITPLKDKTLRIILGYLDGFLYAINFDGQLVKVSI